VGEPGQKHNEDSNWKSINSSKSPQVISAFVRHKRLPFFLEKLVEPLSFYFLNGKNKKVDRSNRHGSIQQGNTCRMTIDP